MELRKKLAAMYLPNEPEGAPGLWSLFVKAACGVCLAYALVVAFIPDSISLPTLVAAKALIYSIDLYKYLPASMFPKNLEAMFSWVIAVYLISFLFWPVQWFIFSVSPKPGRKLFRAQFAKAHGFWIQWILFPIGLVLIDFSICLGRRSFLGVVLFGLAFCAVGQPIIDWGKKRFAKKTRSWFLGKRIVVPVLIIGLGLPSAIQPGLILDVFSRGYLLLFCAGTLLFARLNLWQVFLVRNARWTYATRFFGFLAICAIGNAYLAFFEPFYNTDPSGCNRIQEIAQEKGATRFFKTGLPHYLAMNSQGTHLFITHGKFAPVERLCFCDYSQTHTIDTLPGDNTTFKYMATNSQKREIYFSNNSANFSGVYILPDDQVVPSGEIENSECPYATDILFDESTHRLFVPTDRGCLYSVDMDTQKIDKQTELLNLTGHPMRLPLVYPRMDKANNALYLVKGFVPALIVLDPLTLETKNVVTLAGIPAGMVVNEPAELLYIALPFKAKIAIMNSRSYEVLGYLDAGFGVRWLAADPKQNLLFATNFLEGTFDVFDLKSNKRIERYQVGAVPRGIQVDPINNRVYVASGCGITFFNLDHWR